MKKSANAVSDYTPTEGRILRYTHPTYGKVIAVSEDYWETMIASVKAEAWDEGYAVDRRFNAPTPNPYREAVTE